MGDNNDVMTQLLARLGVDYTPALANMKSYEQALARHSETVAGQFAKIEKQMQTTGKGYYAGDMARAAMEREKIIFDQHGRELVRVQGQTYQNLMKVQKDASKTAEKEAREHASRFGEISSQLERRMGWFVAGASFYGAADVFRQVVKAVGEVEMGMTQIARIQDDPSFNFEKVQQNLFNLGKEFGQQWAPVQDIYLRWSQAGYDTAQSLELTRTSLLALNTAELDAAQSTQSMIAVMSQWNLEAKDLLPVLDMINKTADEYAISSGEILDGLVRSSGAAKVLKLSLQETIAILTAMREASGRTGREVGNALNSILSYMQRPKAIDAFETAGIKIWANEAKTQYRSVMEVFSELSSRWTGLPPEIQDSFVNAADAAGLFASELDVLTDVEKTELAQAGAGVYRRNYLIALLERWGVTTKVLTDIEKSHGYSLAENDRTMQAYTKKVESLRMATTELAVAIGKAGLLDVMKGLVDGTKGAVDEFRELPELVQESIIVFGGLTGALLLVNFGFRTFMGMGIGGMLISVAAQIAGVKAATLGLGEALGILARNPIVQLISVLGILSGAVIAYGNYQAEAVARISDSIRQHEGAAKAAKDQADKIGELTRQYQSLEGQSNRTTAQENQLKSVQDEMKKLLPELKVGYDSAGNAIFDFGNISEVAADKVSILNDQMKEQLRIAAKVAGTQISKLEEERQKAAEKKQGADIAIDRLNAGEDYHQLIPELHRQGKWYQLHMFPDRKTVTREFGDIFAEASKNYQEADKAYQEAQKAIETWKSIEEGTWAGMTGGGTATGRGASAASSGSGSPLDANKEKVKDLTSALKEMGEEARSALRPYTDELYRLDSLLSAASCSDSVLITQVKTRGAVC